MCERLNSCLIADHANLVNIDKEAVSGCHLLRSFCIPKRVELISEDCFTKCCSLCRLRFVSSESLTKLTDDCPLDEGLGQLGLHEILSLLRIEIGDGLLDFELPGWSTIAEETSRVTLVQPIP
jgi:hypothetical protein